MHQSPQKQIETRRDRNAVYAAFDLADDDFERRPSRGGGQPRMRKSDARDDAPRAPRTSRQHPRG